MFICVKDRFNFRNGKSCGDICRADVRRSPPLPRAEGGAAAVGHESRRDFFEPSLAGFPFFTIFTYAKSSNVPKLRIIVGCMAGFSLLAAGLRVRAQPPHGVAFYDADCLYDTVPSPFGNDTRYLPQGEMRWTGERYRRKVMQTAAVIDSLGLPLVGLYGVENESVVRDVAAACKGDYAYLFRTTDSYNGLDFALFYFGDRFFPDRVEAGHFWMTAAGELRGAGRVCLLMSASDRYIGYKIEEHRRQHPDERLLVDASEWIGTPYRAGGDSKRGTDCSGLVSQLYKKVYHTRLSRSTDGQLKESSKISRRNLREGDLVFFTSRASRKKVAHVGIYLKDGKFIHASTSQGVIVSNLREKYYTQHWLCGGRIK